MDDMEQLSERLMLKRIGGMLYPEALELIDAHRRKGHRLVLASSATRYQVSPLADELLIDEIICTEVEVVNGVFTGKLASPVRWGRARRRRSVSWRRSAASTCGGASGTATATRTSQFLEAVGKPRPLNPQRGLASVAAERGWPVTRLTPRAGRRLRPLLRTGAAMAGMGAAAFVGAGVGLANSSRRVGGQPHRRRRLRAGARAGGRTARRHR